MLRSGLEVTLVNGTGADLRNCTCEAHESSLFGLSPQPLHIFVVDVDQVDSLQPKSFGDHNHLLPCVKELPGIFRPRGTLTTKYRAHARHVGHMHVRISEGNKTCRGGGMVRLMNR